MKTENPLLAVAVEAGDFQCTKALMEAGANPETLPAESLVELVNPSYAQIEKRHQELYGDTSYTEGDSKRDWSLHKFWAKTLKDRSKTVRLLLDSGADLKKCGLDPHKKVEGPYGTDVVVLYDMFQKAIEDIGARWCMADRVKLLVKAGIDVNAVTEEGECPSSFYVARFVNTVDRPMIPGDETMKVMLDAGLNPNTTYNGQTLLQEAVRYASPKMVKYLLDAGADAHVVDKETGNTLLMEIALLNVNPNINAHSDAGEVVRLLLLAGVDPHLKNKQGQTALQAIEKRCKGDYEIYAGSLSRFGYEQVFKLLRAVDNPKELKKLLAKPMATSPKSCQYGSIVREGGKEKFVPSISAEKAKEILKYAANKLESSLGYAVWAKDMESMELLITAGADVNTHNQYESSPLCNALGSPDIECIRLLLAAGADPNLADKEGRLPLQLAAKQCSAERLRLLLDAGADVHAVGKDGKTALQILEATGTDKKGYQQCLELLQAAEKK